MTDDARALLRRIDELDSPRYTDAHRLLAGNHLRAQAAVAELVELGLIEHRNNGQLRRAAHMSVIAGHTADE